MCVFSHSVVSDALQPMDCNLPGSSVHGIQQARILEWVAIFFSKIEHIYTQLTNYKTIIYFITIVRLRIRSSSILTGASQVALVVKNLPANAGDIRDAGSIPGSGRSPGGGHGNPLQHSCLENTMDRGDWAGYCPQGPRES